ncbi:MAG: aminomethyl-transferring glycine dehydrogenase [Bacteroidetes bacterium]|nr:aminomethyl-transferring glycine dehydrogenase [Bacteroidota bacterium]
MNKFETNDRFPNRHIGPDENETIEMLSVIGVDSLDELITKTIPNKIRLGKKLDLNEPLAENKFIAHLRSIASKNKIYKSLIGMGYYPTITPSVILRNILENPGWYTQYTPYQAEISQGRLEAVLNFQTMVSDLTGMQLANASLLDEATAAAEAMTMFFNLRKGSKKNANVFFVSDNLFPQTIDVLKTRAEPLGIKLEIGDYKTVELTDEMFGLIVQYPDSDGVINNFSEFFGKADEKNILKAVAADLMSLALLTPPGEFGADVALGTTQRFGVPMGFGGPHAGYFATKDDFKRQMPGRMIGVSIDTKERPALRMALQTREQHIKREKATSNICTAQVLLAILASMYAVYHGPDGIKAISSKIHNTTKLADLLLKEAGLNQVNETYFDTLKVKLDSLEDVEKVRTKALLMGINLRYFGNEHVGFSVGECTRVDEILMVVNSFTHALGKDEITMDNVYEVEHKVEIDWPSEFLRTSDYLTHPVFNSYRSESEMMRYIKSLEKRDLSLTQSMIPLGSCTMKLNAATEMLAITWPEFSSIHPFAPEEQTEGYTELIQNLEKQLCEITGFAAISLQPNSGAAGEYAGLMAIRNYHLSRGDDQRNVVLIPSSAHGTNPASAVMAGGKVIVTKCDEKGNIDVEDLKARAEEYKDTLSALMVTYPSTHGVFEESIMEVCKIIHDNGGQVYMDGANMNAQVGFTSPGHIGADVCHLNLHKTFAIPHGGGGPGVGPIGVAKHLVPFLPGHKVVDMHQEKNNSAVSAAPWGSAGVLPISYAYITMMGAEGLTDATRYAILNANYIKARLEKHYSCLYTGTNGFVGHEMIFDFREFKQSAGIEVIDVAKRLMDYNFHAPTVSFPVAGTLMIEPTESEAKAELDRFCDALISIREELRELEEGKADKEDNLLVNAPHTAEDVMADEWTHPYSRSRAAFPLDWVKANKFWPAVSRVNDAYGDRNLVCSCLPIEAYEGNK